MEDGKIIEMGAYKELLTKRANFAELIKTFGDQKENEEKSSVSSEQIQ